mgnify:CR=1 FL=1
MRLKSMLLAGVACSVLTAAIAPVPTVAQETAKAPHSNQYWWPDMLDLSVLRDQDPRSNPLGPDFDYAAAFETLDYAQLKADINTLMTTSQDWWPADYGNYGPFFIRMAWHSTGTYRLMDGRGGGDGGQQRFAPLNSWPDNASLDKARRLLWPIKQKYGAAISWSDLIVLAGTMAMDNMGFPTYGFAGGREDDWEPELVYWGPESVWLGAQRQEAAGEFNKRTGATQMGLIYVNPQGPQGEPDPMGAASMIRESFGRMAMNDAETVALIAGGHTFGKAHGAMKNDDCLGPEPAASDVEEQGLGWKNSCGKGKAEDTFTSGLEGAWTSTPTAWSSQYLSNLMGYEWETTKSPAGATQWVPKDGAADGTVPDAHRPDVTHAPMMFTTDIALKKDPAYRKVVERFLDNPKEFNEAFAKAWFKLTHRDMGPAAGYLGPDVPEEAMLWQDPLPKPEVATIDATEAEALKSAILESGIDRSALVRAAWASASSFRASDMRGGANGARLRLAPQKSWEANDPEELATTLAALEDVRAQFNEGLGDGTAVSMADTIVLGGAAAIEAAARDAGHDVTVPFRAGRVDATPEMTDEQTFAYLEPEADGFRNYYSSDAARAPAQALVNRADLLDLTVPEMTVLVGGMRALDANAGGSSAGVLTDAPGTLSNDFFVNLLDMSTEWEKSEDRPDRYVGYDRATGEQRWTASPVDLVFGSNSELRAVAQVYGADDGTQRFVDDFVAAWTKVMNLDRMAAAGQI